MSTAWSILHKIQQLGVQDSVALVQTFIYLLCSTCLRVIVAKVKNFGFTRSMDTSLSDNVWSKYVDTEEKTK